MTSRQLMAVIFLEWSTVMIFSWVHVSRGWEVSFSLDPPIVETLKPFLDNRWSRSPLYSMVMIKSQFRESWVIATRTLTPLMCDSTKRWLLTTCPLRWMTMITSWFWILKDPPPCALWRALTFTHFPQIQQLSIHGASIWRFWSNISHDFFLVSRCGFDGLDIFLASYLMSAMLYLLRFCAFSLDLEYFNT